MDTNNQVKHSRIEELMSLRELSLVLLKLFSIIVFSLLVMKTII